MAATVIALVWATSPWSESDASLWASELAIGLGDFHLRLLVPCGGGAESGGSCIREVDPGTSSSNVADNPVARV
jgi:hypothetical protein